MKTFAVVLCLLAGSMRPASAQLPFPIPLPFPISITGDIATETTQILNRIQLAAAAATAGLQLATARSQLSVEQQTLAELIRMGTLLQNLQWTNPLQDLQNIAALAQQGQGLAFSIASLDAQFKATYPGYAAPVVPFPVRYARWAQTAMDTIQGSLRTTGTSWQQIQSEQFIIQNYRGQAVALTTPQQSAMLTNETQVEALNQLNKLRQIMLSDIQAKRAFEAFQVQKDIEKRYLDDAFYAPGTVGRDGVRW
jgi:P-type conjugative transfer protein TrbJ